MYGACSRMSIAKSRCAYLTALLSFKELAGNTKEMIAERVKDEMD